jgi:CheY-like chemotaxis protein
MYTAQPTKKFRPRFIAAEEHVSEDLNYQCFEEGAGTTGLELVPVRKNSAVVRSKSETKMARTRMDLLFLCNENECPEETRKDELKCISEPTFSVFPKPFSKLHQQANQQSSLATIRTITLNVTPTYPIKPIPCIPSPLPSPTSRSPSPVPSSASRSPSPIPSPTSRSPVDKEYKPKTEVKIPTPTRLMSVTVTTSSTRMITPEPQLICNIKSETDNFNQDNQTTSSFVSTGRKRVISQVTTTTINVLYAEDSEFCRLLTSRTCAHLAGVKCDTVEDGIECCKKIEENPEQYQLILMDIIMPGMDGIDAAARIRNLGLNIPIIALSGVSTQDIKQRCATAGMNGFLSKPLTIAKLKKVLLDQNVS